MALNRRKFLGQSLAFGVLMPPVPPTILRSPKDTEHVQSLTKVSVQSFAPVLPPATPISGLRLTSISVSGNQVTLSWVEGVGPFMVEQGDLHGQWGPIGNLTMARTQTIASVTPEAFFRIHDKVPMQMSAEDNPDGVHLSWTPPTFQ